MHLGQATQAGMGCYHAINFCAMERLQYIIVLRGPHEMSSGLQLATHRRLAIFDALYGVQTVLKLVRTV